MFTNKEQQLITKNICINVAKNMIGYNDPNFQRIHHVNHHIVLFIKDYIMKEKCKTYLELGTHFGHSLSTLLSSKYYSKYLSVDLFDVGKTIANDCIIKNVEKIANDNAKKYNVNNYNYKILKGNTHSSSIINSVKSHLSEGIDLLFIDADHRYNAVIKDFEAYFSLVNKDGYIIFDDYLPIMYRGRERDCPKAVDFLISKYKKYINVIGQIEDIVESNKYRNRNFKLNTTFIIQKII